MTASSTALPQAAPDTSDEQWQRNAVLRWFVHLRWMIFALVIVVILSCFNGRWRVARDSALYRGVAKNLITGQGYTFRGEHERHIYPGFPLLLAGIDKVFGPQDPMKPTAAVGVVVGMALLTLVAIYHTVRLYFPVWVAVCVTTGVGVNKKFIQHAHDLMSDIPFMLGVSVALLGIGLLMKSPTRGKCALGTVFMIVGGALALATRPTFWALAGAWGLIAGIGVILGPRRGAHALMLLVLVVLAGAFMALDPRTAGASALRGKYEQKAISTLGEVAQLRIGERAVAMFEEAVPEAFYGLELGGGIDTIASIVILASMLLFARAVPLWAAYAALTVVMLFIFGPIPRYFLMIAPLMLLGVALLLYRISLLVPQRKFLPELVIFLGTGVIVSVNLVRVADLFMEQHALTFDGPTEYLKRYHRGKMYPVVKICEEIVEPGSGYYVEPHRLILSHEPRIMSYLTGRRAYRAGELSPDGDVSEAVRRIREMNFEYGLFPAGIYDDDELTRQLIEQNLVAPVEGAPSLIVNDVRFTRMRVVAP